MIVYRSKIKVLVKYLYRRPRKRVIIEIKEKVKEKILEILSINLNIELENYIDSITRLYM